MSPDDRMQGGPHRDEADVLVPFTDPERDPELASLGAELGRAGERMRRAHARDGRERPSTAFTASLRARLVAEAATPPVPSLGAALARADAAGADAAGADAAGLDAAVPAMAAAGGPAPETYDRVPSQVSPRVERRTPTILPAPRWSILAVAAVLVASVLGLTVERFLPAPAPARVAEAVAATLVRDGTPLALTAGTELRAGDTVTVTDTGRATLALGGSSVRLAEGASVRLDTLTDGIALEQLAGRAWHRVDVSVGQAYAVTTGRLRWTALGTAFDVSWQPDGRRVRILTVQDDLSLAGPGIELRVPEGRETFVDARSDTPDVTLDRVAARDLDDPWLLANARLDREAGFDIGWLTTTLVDPSVGPTPTRDAPDPATSAPTADPSIAPATPATPGPTAPPTTKPTPKPTPKPTVKPTPTATATPASELATLSLNAVACGGAVLLEWGGDPGAEFHHWTALRAESSFEVPASYPPPDGIAALDGSYSKNPSATRFADTSLAPGVTVWYRAVGWSVYDRAVAASAAKSLTGKPVASLGTTGATPKPGGAEVTWTAYSGPAACFTYYKISWSSTSSDPSYLGDNDGAYAVGGQGETYAAVGLPEGTYWIRVEAILGTDYSKAVVGRSVPVQVTVTP